MNFLQIKIGEFNPEKYAYPQASKPIKAGTLCRLDFNGLKLITYPSNKDSLAGYYGIALTDADVDMDVHLLSSGSLSSHSSSDYWIWVSAKTNSTD